MVFAGCGKAPNLTFLSKTYKLGSFKEKPNPIWEFVTEGEKVENWTSLVTVIDRKDAHTGPELDRLAEGILNTYKSNGGQVLMAKTLKEKSGAPYNYVVAAFEEPAKKRFELTFAKIGMGPKNGYIFVYGVRVTDPLDYRTKTKDFVSQHSAEIGQALEGARPPVLETLPRKEF